MNVKAPAERPTVRVEPIADPDTWMREHGYGAVRCGTVWVVHNRGFHDSLYGSLEDAAKRCQEHYETTREFQLEQRVAKLETVIREHLMESDDCDEIREYGQRVCHIETCTHCALVKAAGSDEAASADTATEAPETCPDCGGRQILGWHQEGTWWCADCQDKDQRGQRP